MSTKKVKYYYNQQTLRYERVINSWKSYAWKLIASICALGLFGILSVVVAFKYIDSPKEKDLRNEIELLRNNYDQVQTKAERMDQVMKELQERDDNIYRVVFEAEPIPKSIREAGVGGSSRYKDLSKYDNGELITETHQNLDKIGRQLAIQSKSYDEILDMVKSKTEMLSAIPAIQPISNQDLVRLASGFGYRIDPIYKTQKMHSGLDFSAQTGTPIFSTGDGYAELVEYSARGYGNHVVINHGYGYATLYAHMSRVNVALGQKVKRGDVIGYVGSTGKSTGPHLHYEVIKDGTKIDPINFFHNDLTPDQYEKMLFISSQSSQSFD